MTTVSSYSQVPTDNDGELLVCSRPDGGVLIEASIGSRHATAVLDEFSRAQLASRLSTHSGRHPDFQEGPSGKAVGAQDTDGSLTLDDGQGRVLVNSAGLLVVGMYGSAPCVLTRAQYEGLVFALLGWSSRPA